MPANEPGWVRVPLDPGFVTEAVDVVLVSHEATATRLATKEADGSLAPRLVLGGAGAGGKPLPRTVAPACQVDGIVRDVVFANGAFFLGGDFNTAWSHARPDRFTRQGIVACDASTGEVLPWYPPGGANGRVRDLAIDDQWLYVAGDFRSLGRRSRSRLGRVALAGAVVDPGWAPDPDGGVHVVEPLANGRLYVGGVFERIAGAVQPAVARLEEDGLLDATFAPRLTYGGWRHSGVFAIEPSSSGQQVFLGGKFTSVNGALRTGFAAVDPASGTTTSSFAPRLADSNPQDPVVQVVDVLVTDDAVYPEFRS